MSCGVGRRRGLHSVLLWLWCRLAATDPIGLLAWEPPHAACQQPQKLEEARHGFVPEVLEASTALRTSWFQPTGTAFGLLKSRNVSELLLAVLSHQACGHLSEQPPNEASLTLHSRPLALGPLIGSRLFFPVILWLLLNFSKSQCCYL